MLMIVDANNMAYRALYTLSLSYYGKDTSITYGSFLMLTALFRKFQPSSIVACFDGGSPAFRLELFPQYKAHRTHNSEERDWEDVYRQIDELCYYAYPLHGIMTLRAEGIEADDLMAQAAHLSPERSIIVTTDDDLLQCVCERTSLYNPTKDQVYTQDNLEELTGVPLNFQRFYKMLCGDASDNIPGVPHIGEVTAKKVISFICDTDRWLDPYNYLELLCSLDELPLNVRQKESFQEMGAERWAALYQVIDLTADRAGARKVVLETAWLPAQADKIRKYYIRNGFVSLLEERTDRLYSNLVKPQFTSPT